MCRWFGKGFQRDLQRFIELIEAGTHERAQQDRVTRAVVKIQATWRMYAAKKRLERAGTAMSKFQKAFRYVTAVPQVLYQDSVVTTLLVFIE